MALLTVDALSSIDYQRLWKKGTSQPAAIEMKSNARIRSSAAHPHFAFDLMDRTPHN